MPTTPVRIIFNFGDKVRISPPIWLEHKLEIQPGDLSKFAPSGNGVYGYQNREERNPFTSAPPEEPCGGVVYFGNDIAREDFEALMRVLGVKERSWDYGAFLAESSHPGKEGFLTQMRVVSKFGLRFMFHALSENEYGRF
ncbi:MAG: hypothetical protein Q8P03_00505, partial [bacterium]|nr:hypothetical protein [bacterium]